MGLLLGIYRKLCLRRRIDNIQAELIGISDLHQRLTRQIADAKQAQTRMVNQVQSVFSQLSNNANMASQMFIGSQFSLYNNAQNAYLKAESEARKNPNDSSLQAAVEKSKEEMMRAQSQGQQAHNFANGIFNMYSQQLAFQKSQYDSQVEAQNKMEMDRLTYLDSEVTMRKTSLETEIKMAQEEYETVGKLVDKEAKDAAPKFGLS